MANNFLTKIVAAAKEANPFRSKDPVKNLNNTTGLQSLARVRQDVQNIVEALNEAERAHMPHRVKMQQLLNQTATSGHVIACMERRRDLTLLRESTVMSGTKRLEDVETMLKAEWFKSLVSYALDAEAYGYQLIALGDIVNNSFPNLTIVKREHISPDRFTVGRYQYSISGDNFTESPFKEWHIYAATPTLNGQSKCGYGYLLYCAVHEIYLRLASGFNMTGLEMFAQPYRVGKTASSEDSDRAALASSLQQLGSSGWAIIDPMDTIEFIETNIGSGGTQGYESMQSRCEGIISKVILGHKDALDSTPGRLGAGQGDDNPVTQALRSKMLKDGAKIENLVNNELFPRMREQGFNIPLDAKYQYSNNEEALAQREREDTNNSKVAEIAATMSQAGLKMDAKYFEERTGIPTIAEPATPTAKFSDNIKNTLNKLYSKPIQ